MEIHELFVNDIARPITQVIKVDDVDETEISQELQEYVVTPQLEQELLKFLEPFVATRRGSSSYNKHIGVWISGFFGSGKSHFAKIIGYLLSNQTVSIGGQQQQALDIFLSKLNQESSRFLDIKGQLTQLRNFFAVNKLMFQIKSHEDQLNKDKESIAIIMYRQYLQMRGFSNDPWIGRLELGLEQDSKLDAFKAAIQEEENASWEDIREGFALIRPSIIRAMCTAMPERYRSEDEANHAFDTLRESLIITPDTLARELAKYATEQEAKLTERTFRLVFIMDEMGQFIGDNSDRLLELQSIGESFDTRGKGRLWLVVTAQEKLEDVIDSVRLERVKFNKIIDRFGIQLRLTSENIQQVLQERILRKRATARPVLQTLYEHHGGQMGNLARPESNRPIDILDEDSIEKTYPFFPYHFQLMQDAFSTLRAKGGSSVQLTGAERSILGVVQGVLKSPYNNFGTSQVGRIVRLDEIYDQVENEVSGSDRRALSSADELDNKGLSPASVLKTIFLLSQVEWLPRTLDNIARMTVSEVKCDYNQHKEHVRIALGQLRDARYINEVDQVYRYLSIEERGIEDEIANERPKTSHIIRTARDLLREVLSGVGRVNYQSGLATFEVKLFADKEEFKSNGVIELHMYSPIGVNYHKDVNIATIRDLESPNDTMKIYWLPSEVTDPENDLKRMLMLDSVIKRRQGNETSDEERAIIRDKQTERDVLHNRLTSVFRRALFNGVIIYDGEETHLDGRVDQLNTIFNRELSRIIPSIYTQFDIAAFPVTEKKIAEMLTTKSANLRNIEPGLHLWDGNESINEHAPVAEAILEWLRYCEQYAQPTDGKALTNRFRDIPYGWNPDILRLVLAALFRAGTIGVTINQRYYADPGEPAAQEALTKTSVFNKAVFEYDSSGGLSLEERKQARQYLDILFERQVTDTTNDLYRALKESIEAVKHRNEILRTQVGESGLPVSDELFEARSLLDELLTSNIKPDKVIKTFLAHLTKVESLIKLQRQLEDFFRTEYHQRYKQLHNLANTLAREQKQITALQESVIQRALEDWRELEQSRSIVSRWNDVLTVGQQFEHNYQRVYNDLFNERTHVYTAVRDQIKPFGPVPDDITTRIMDLPTAWDADALHYIGTPATLTDLHYDIELAPLYQKRIIEKLQTEQTQPTQHSEITSSVVGQTSTKEIRESRPVFINASSILAGEIVDEADLQARLEAFAAKVRDELARGKKVVIG